MLQCDVSDSQLSFLFYISCRRPMLTCEPETTHKDRGKNTLYLWWAVTVGSGDNVAQVSPPDEHPLPAASHTHHSTSANKTRGTWGTMWPGHRHRQRHANVDQNHCGKRCRMRAGGKKGSVPGTQRFRGQKVNRKNECFFSDQIPNLPTTEGDIYKLFFMLHFWLAIDWPWCQHSKLTFLNFLHYFRVKTSRYIFFLLTHFICSAS